MRSKFILGLLFSAISLLVNAQCSIVSINIDSYTNVSHFGCDDATVTVSVNPAWQDGFSYVNSAQSSSYYQDPIIQSWYYPLANGATVGQIPSLIAGSTYFIFQDGICADTTSTINITQPPPAFTVNIDSVTNASQFGCGNGQITLTVNSNDCGTFFRISQNGGGYGGQVGSGQAVQFNNLDTGTYYFGVQEWFMWGWNYGVSDSFILVKQSITPVVHIAEPACNIQIALDSIVNVINYPVTDGSITITASTAACAGYNMELHYQGNTVDSLVGLTSGNPYTFSGLDTGNYSVTVTPYVGGCSASTGNIILPGPPCSALSLTFSSTPQLCNLAGTASVYATGGIPPYQYAWPDGQVTETAQGLLSNTYDVTVTDQNRCSSWGAVNVGGGNATVAASVSTTGATCNIANGTATAIATGGTGNYIYEWSTGALTGSLQNLSAGNYFVTVSDMNGCSATAANDVLQLTDGIQVQVNTGNSHCGYGGSAQAITSGGVGAYYYAWSNGVMNAAAITGLTPGNYTVVAGDGNGCTASAVGPVVDSALVITGLVVSSTAICTSATGTASVAVSGGTPPYIWLWSNGQNTATATHLTTGLYQLQVSDANGCTATFTVNVPDSIVSIQPHISTTPAGCAASIGSATATASGGNLPYGYQWSNGAVTSSVTGLAAATYRLTITDSHGCSVVASAIVSAGTLKDSIAIQNTTCAAADGSATAVVTGGAMPYSYSWSTGSTGTGITGQTAGSYSVTITDNLGCVITDTVQIAADNGNLSDSILVINGLCTLMQGSITVYATGGSGTYTYAWSIGQFNSTITNLAAGTYTVTITDSNGCSLISSDSVSDSITATIFLHLAAHPAICTALNGSVTAYPVGGVLPYTYLWGGSQSTASVTGQAAGIYTLTVTDANGCIATGTDTITVFQNTINAQIGGVVAPVCTDTNGVLVAMPAGGTTPYAFNWSNGIATASNRNLGAGTYNLTVTDAQGCSASAQSILTANSGLLQAFTFSTPETGPGQGGQVTVNAAAGTAPYTYAWNTGGSTNQISGLATGTYSVTVTDANGCIASASASVGAYNLVNCMACFVIVEDSVSNGIDSGYNCSTGNNISYLWNFGDDSTSTEINPVHNYAHPGRYLICLQVSDSSGCSNSYCDSSFYLMDSTVMRVGIGNHPLFNAIAAINISPEISLYPNPAGDKINVSIGSKMIGFHYYILDITGRELQQGILVRQLTEMDISSFADGVYLFRLAENGNKVFRIIKSR